MMNQPQQLSILIPTHNDECLGLVQSLCRQAEALKDLQWEVIVADDGSTDSSVKAANSPIGKLPRCRYLEKLQNVGRAAIRNYLMQQARYDLLLFLDSDMTVIRKDFLLRYLQMADCAVVYGGYQVVGNQQQLKNNLRFRYEQANAHLHTVEKRSAQPHTDFHTSNFLVRRNVLAAHPLDERFVQYGYEDVLWGKQLRDAGINIQHIDNPVGFGRFESNAQFLAKTETSLHTLHQFQNALSGYSTLLTVAHQLQSLRLAGIVRAFHALTATMLRRNLTGNHPSLFLFKLYKLGFFTSLLSVEKQHIEQ